MVRFAGQKVDSCVGPRHRSFDGESKTGGMGMNRAIVVLAVVLVALLVAPLALSQNDTSLAAYGGEQGVQAELAQSDPAAVASQSLPFTGFDVGLLVLGGSILVLVGLGMRRFGRQRH